MPAYLIVNVEITDPEKYEEYRKVASPTVDAFGGKYLARGGTSEALEGDWTPNRLIVIEFESIDRAKEWWSSETYRTPKQMRQASANAQMIVVEGVS